MNYETALRARVYHRRYVISLEAVIALIAEDSDEFSRIYPQLGG